GQVLVDIEGGVVGGVAHLLEAGLDDQLGVVLLEAIARLYAQEAHRLLAVDVPPVALVLTLHLRSPLEELLVDAIHPQVRWLDDVAVLRDHGVKTHEATIALAGRARSLTGAAPNFAAFYRTVLYKAAKFAGGSGAFGCLDGGGEAGKAVEGDVEGLGLG